MEIAFLKERGLVSSYEDYLRLPQAVVEDARMLALREGEEYQRSKQQKSGGRRGKLR